MGKKERSATNEEESEVTCSRKRLRPRNHNLDLNENSDVDSPQEKKIKREVKRNTKLEIKNNDISPKKKKIKKEMSSNAIFLKNLEEKVKSKKCTKKVIKEEITNGTNIVKKNVAPIDKECPIGDSCIIYSDSDGFWDCMLNQTNIEFNNNKYYLIQLLQKLDSKTEKFFVWMRWGRIGFSGQNTLKEFGSNLQAAKNVFTKKFSDKTMNDWEGRSAFMKVQGKYDLIYLDYQPSEDVPDSVKEVKKVESVLETHVKSLIELICDVKAMEESLVELLYDSKRAPLGKLTVDQVVAGYAALKTISDIVESSSVGSRKSLLKACNLYYTRVPHAFKMRIPPLIDTMAQIEVEMTLLNVLADIQAAMDVIGMEAIHNSSKNPTDEHYERLKCDIHHLDENNDERKLLEKYMKTTHGKTHNMYSLEVEHIFKIEKLTKKGSFKDVGNRMLLWHGSRHTNWAGILSQGLRIAPPEAPSTGYMFGKGIYFSDMASKSANYCNASPSKPRGILVLCEVSLGKPNKLLQADYNANKLPAGCHSVYGCGKTTPDPKNLVTLDDGMLVPMGPSVTIDNKSAEKHCLQYNEFIVYDPLQVKMKYLMQVKFDFSCRK